MHGYWFRETSVPAPEPAVAPSPDRTEASRLGRRRTVAGEPHVPWSNRTDFGARSPSQPWPAEPEFTEAEIDAEAERYAVIYPVRAARIRAAGGLPPDLDFGPPEPHIVAGLLRHDPASRAIRQNPTNRDSETESTRP